MNPTFGDGNSAVLCILPLPCSELLMVNKSFAIYSKSPYEKGQLADIALNKLGKQKRFFQKVKNKLNFFILHA
jgi:hypothetical protein